MSKVWPVTGSASGLGRNIAEAVLACGIRLIATARTILNDKIIRRLPGTRLILVDLKNSR
jgi:NAD(P)-dependent dehydrogenase (short-subunit alcohol dehydrogenase family)